MGLPQALNSRDEGRFIAHVETPAEALVTDLKVDLWMDMGGGHGHGSGPVTLKDGGSNHYAVTNAWFVMAGPWLVRLDFIFERRPYHLEIPVDVAP